MQHNTRNILYLFLALVWGCGGEVIINNGAASNNASNNGSQNNGMSNNETPNSSGITNNNGLARNNGSNNGSSNNSTGSSGGTATNNVDATYPPSTLFVSSSSSTPRQPDYLETVDETSFETQITRITDRGNRSDFGKHPYPVQGTPWNFDGTVYNLGTRLYRTVDHSEIITAGLDNDAAWYKTGETYGGHSGAGLFWSHTDPDIMYSAMDNANGFLKLTMNADRNDITATTIVDLSDRNYERLSIGNGEGSISHDGKFILLVATKSGGRLDLILVNLLTDSEVWTKESVEGNAGNLDYISVDATGTFIVGKINRRTNVYDINLDNHYLMPGNNPEGTEEGFIGHSNFGINTKNESVVISMTHNKGTISMFNLKTRERHELLNDNYGGGHVSAGNYKRPGWAYISTAGWNGKGRDVFAVQLDPDRSSDQTLVQMFARSHNDNDNNDYDYQTHVGVNPVGDNVIFRSKWNTSVGDTYMATAKKDD